MPTKRALAHCLFALILTLLVMAAAYNVRLQQGISDDELRLTLSVQSVLDRLVGPGRSHTWVELANGRLQALVTVDSRHGEPEKYRAALESLLNVDVSRGDRLDLVSGTGERHRSSYAHEWRKARLIGLVSLLLALGYLMTVPARSEKRGKIAAGVLAFGVPLWVLHTWGGLTAPWQLCLAGGVLLVVGRPWREKALTTSVKLTAVALVASLVYTCGMSPEARLNRQVQARLGAPVWVESVQRGGQWGSVAAMPVSPADSAPALALGQLENTARQALPGTRLSLLGVQEAPVRGPWRLIVLNLLGIAAVFYALRKKPATPPPAAPEPVKQPEAKKPPTVIQLMQVDPYTIEVGRGLLFLVDPRNGARLLERVTGIRRHIAEELGIVLPGVRFRDNLTLKNNEYRFLMRTVEVGRGELQPGRLLTIGPAHKIQALGELTADPTYSMPAVWIEPDQRLEAEKLGSMLFDEVSVVAIQFTELIRKHAPKLLLLQETKALIDTLRKTHPAVVDLAEHRLGLMLIWEVLQGLLAEGVSIRDLELVLTAMLRSGDYTVEALVEACRDELALQICQSLQRPGGSLVATDLPEEVERLLRRSPDGSLDPADASQALEILQAEISRFDGLQPILLTQPGLRLSLRRLTERSLPQVVCLSYTQVAPGITLKEPPAQV